MESRLNSKTHDGWLPFILIQEKSLHTPKLDSTLLRLRVLRPLLFSHLLFQAGCDYCGLKKFNVNRCRPNSLNLCWRHGYFTLCTSCPKLKSYFPLRSEFVVKNLELLMKSCDIVFCL